MPVGQILMFITTPVAFFRFKTMQSAVLFATLKAILHYALGLHFRKVCEQKREKNARKTQEKLQEKCDKSMRKL